MTDVPEADDELLLEDVASITRVGPVAADVAKLVSAILDEDKNAGWSTLSAPLTFSSVTWRPELQRLDKQRILHAHLGDAIPTYIAKRIQAARTAGFTITIALELESLYSADILRSLSEYDANVYVRGSRQTPLRSRHFLAAIADEGVPVAPDLRRAIAKRAWELRSEGTAYERGRRFEALLAFLLGQVSDLRIFERNLRNKTQEIDIVLQVDNFSSRSWFKSGVPFILVEAKNWVDPADQPTVSLLFRKLSTKRKRSQLGFLFSVSGFTQDAEIEEIRSSESDLCVVMFDGPKIIELIEAGSLDDTLEAMVNHAILR